MKKSGANWKKRFTSTRAATRNCLNGTINDALLKLAIEDGEMGVRYQISMEVSGPLAIFARPDAGGTPTSYPVAPWSAAKGIFESIAMFGDGAAWICPTRLEICRRVGSEGGIRYQRYMTNYGGPLRKGSLVSSGDGMQLAATVLSDICYRIYADVCGDAPSGGRNPSHHLQDLFNRRLSRGQAFRTPALGWREFTCSYWGTFRGDYEIDSSIDLIVPSLMHSVWDREHHGEYAPRFVQNAKIEGGVLCYVE